MKKVVLTVVVANEYEAQAVANQMGNSHIAQEGLYTLECGGTYDLTDDEEEEVLNQVDEFALSFYYVDKNGEDIEDGLTVDVDESEENKAFRGTVVGVRGRYVEVEDMEGDVFCILPKNLEVG